MTVTVLWASSLVPVTSLHAVTVTATGYLLYTDMYHLSSSQYTFLKPVQFSEGLAQVHVQPEPESL